MLDSVLDEIVIPIVVSTLGYLAEFRASSVVGIPITFGQPQGL